MKLYNSEKHSKLKHKFPGSELIQTNYSQTCQDMFVLTMLNGKRNGYFLEIGANEPIVISNTYLLETTFDWTGVSIDVDWCFESLHLGLRKNKFIVGDALSLDYKKIFVENKFPTQIDYLQLDIDQYSVKCLGVLPMNDYRFSVITFEHDIWQNNEQNRYAKTESRRILNSLGYEMVVGNVSNMSSHDPYEDWWVDPNVVDKSIIQQFKVENDINTPGDEILLVS